MGLGRFGGGVDVAEFTCKAGAKVTVTDLASGDELSESVDKLKQFSEIDFHLGGHDKNDFSRSDIVIANPAVPLDNEYLSIAKESGAAVTSQIGIFFELCPALIIGITGANGKSTTTALTAHLLRAGTAQEDFKYRKVWLGGNIGNEPLLTTIDEVEGDDIVVLELSSFQVEQLAQIGKMPRTSLLTNLLPNHLDRYGTFEAYCASKEHVFRLQSLNERGPAVSIFNAEDKIGCEWFEKYKDDKGRVCTMFSADDVSEDIRSCFSLPGRANLSNLAAALTIARQYGVTEERIKEVLPKFRALPHRLELIAEHRGVKWYNDSKATTPESTMAALEAFEVPEILIAGGYDKNLPFDELGALIAQKCRAVILIGQTAKKIANAIERSSEDSMRIEFAESLESAVELANHLAVKGDVVVLSPACASYDMFDNFEHRGRQFVELVRKLLLAQ